MIFTGCTVTIDSTSAKVTGIQADTINDACLHDNVLLDKVRRKDMTGEIYKTFRYDPADTCHKH